MGAGKEKVPINDESLNQRWDFLMMHYFNPRTERSPQT